MSLQRNLGIALLCVALALLAWFISHSSRVPPSFDGAMNLQVSWSLAEGDGYRRTYGERPAFPAEVQTNAPYVVPAALVFKTFGVGIAQAQVVNQLYLALYALAAAWLLWRRVGPLGAGLGAVFALATPGILRYGMNGYGEVAALAWALLALVAFAWEDQGRTLRRTCIAGLCLGLAVCTKTVLGIGVVLFGLVMLAVLATDTNVPTRTRLRHAVALGVAALLPVLVFELWRRASVVDGPTNPVDWHARLDAIKAQAGFITAFQDTTNLVDKFRTHFGFLGKFFGLSGLALWTWLLGPVAIALVLFVRGKVGWRRHAPLIALLLAAGAYFAWWLFITPTGKAWHRRILDGAMLLDIAWAYVAALGLSVALREQVKPAARALAWVPVLACVLFGAQFFRKDALPLLRAEPDPRNLMRAVDTLKGLPADAPVFGIGWYSAPLVSLLAERPVRDFNDSVVRDLDLRKPAYFVFDTEALGAHRNEDALALYPTQPMLPPETHMQVLRSDLSEFLPLPAPTPGKAVTPTADLKTNDYPYTRGFYGAESNGTRWMRTDAEVLLKYNGSPTFGVSLYAMPVEKLHRPGGMTIGISLEGCDLGRKPIEHGGIVTIAFEIPERCRPRDGQDVVARITTDNFVVSDITRDDRGVTVAMREIGFSDKP